MVKIIRNPFREVEMGAWVWIEYYPGQWWKAQFHSVRGTHVKVWHPLSVTEEKFMQLPMEKVKLSKPLKFRIKR